MTQKPGANTEQPHQLGLEVGCRQPEALHCFWQGVFGVWGLLSGQWPSSGQTFCCVIGWFVAASLLHVFVSLLSWQLRLIRDPVSHNVHRACLGEASFLKGWAIQASASVKLVSASDSGCLVCSRRGVSGSRHTPDCQVLVGLLPFM